MAAKENWTSPELERRIDASFFERVSQSPAKLSAMLRETHPQAKRIFRDSYLLDFLELPEPHSEGQLQRGLVADLRRFLTELGKDFCYIGEQYCKSKGSEVVEYSLSRTLSPSLVAEYRTQLPDRKILQRKLAEFYELETRSETATRESVRNHRFMGMKKGGKSVDAIVCDLRRSR